MDQPNSKGLDFKAFFKKCFEDAIISNETQLKENLNEIIDHKVYLNMNQF